MPNISESWFCPCLSRTRQKIKGLQGFGIEQRFVQGLQQMDLASNTGKMVLQLCVGLGHRILPQHLHDDRDDLLPDTRFARSRLVSIISREFGNLSRRRWLGIGEGFGETVQGPADQELHLKRGQPVHECCVYGEGASVLERYGCLVEERDGASAGR